MNFQFFHALLRPRPVSPPQQETPPDLVEFEKARGDLVRQLDVFGNMVRDMQSPRPRKKPAGDAKVKP